MRIVIFEDEHVSRFLPLLHFKPVYLLTTGFRTLFEKFHVRLGGEREISCHLRRYLEPVFRRTLPVFYPQSGCGDLLLVNGRLLCDEASVDIMTANPPGPGQCLVQGDDMIFARISAETQHGRKELSADVIDTAALASRCEIIDVDGFTLLCNIWDPVALHPFELARDAESIEFGKVLGEVSSYAALENPDNIFIAEGAAIKPGAVLDAGSGFIAVSSGAVIESQSVLADNIFIDTSARVRAGAHLHDNVSIGSFSKTGGEIEDSIVEPFANKQHEGFLGHSYLSSWCNLGAGTNTSDLRNDYGKVSIVHGEDSVQTGLQFLGLIMGEHTRCSINSMFNTGTVAGTSSNIFGSGFPQKNIPSFSWGGAGHGFEPYTIDKAIEAARVVMARRNVLLSPEYEAMFRYAASLEQGTRMSL